MEHSFRSQLVTKNLIITLFFLITIGLLIVPSCNKREDSPFSNDWTIHDGKPIQITSDGFSSQHRPEEALPLADLVVLGEITSIAPARWNTASGQRPTKWQFTSEWLLEWMIYTPFSFKINETLAGSPSHELESQFAVVGGMVDRDIIDTTRSIDIYTDIQIGDSVILFLKQAAGNLKNVAPYVYIDALRIDGEKAVAHCPTSRQECQVSFELADILGRVAQKDHLAMPETLDCDHFPENCDLVTPQ